MKAEDKFGRRIYPKTFLILQKYGNMLEEQGWKESQRKPNLFFKAFDEIIVFADMRGTEIVPIWEDPCPLLYATRDNEDWKRRRALRYAIAQLDSIGTPHRYSFYDECEPLGAAPKTASSKYVNQFALISMKPAFCIQQDPFLFCL